MDENYDKKMCETKLMKNHNMEFPYPDWGGIFLDFTEKELQRIKKTPPESPTTSVGYSISGDPLSRIAHLEHSVRFLQEQHRLMLNGLHAEIEALRERNRDLQFQLIFNKEIASKSLPTPEKIADANEETKLKEKIAELKLEATAAKEEAKTAEAKIQQLQELVNAQAEKLRQLDLQKSVATCECECGAPGGPSRAEVRARLSESERAARRLREEGDRLRREVDPLEPVDPLDPVAPEDRGVTNLLYVDVARRHAGLQCMKNTLQASMRVNSMDPGFGYHNTYNFPPVHNPEFWREPLREDFNLMGSRNRHNRRPLTLPELSATGHQIPRSTVYANHHTRPRANGFENKVKRSHTINSENVNYNKSPEEMSDNSLDSSRLSRSNSTPGRTPREAIKQEEVKCVIAKILPSITSKVSGAAPPRPCRPRRAPDHS